MGTNDRLLPARRGPLHGSCRASWPPCSDAANLFSILTKGHADPARRRPAGGGSRGHRRGWLCPVGSADEDLCRVLEPGRPARGAASRCAPRSSAAGPAVRGADGPGGAVPVRLPAQLAATVRQARAGRCVLGHPHRAAPAPRAREWFFGWLDEHHPELVPATAACTGARAYAPRAYQQRVSEQVRELARRYRVGQQGSLAQPARAGASFRGGPATRRDRGETGPPVPDGPAATQLSPLRAAQPAGRSTCSPAARPRLARQARPRPRARNPRPGRWR